MRRARVTSRDGLSRPTLVVPVVVDADGAHLSSSIPADLGGHSLERLVPPETCRRHGLSETAGSTLTWASPGRSTVVLVSVGAEAADLDRWRRAGAAALRLAGTEDLCAVLPVDGLEHPGDVAAALVEGALLASYQFRERDDEAWFDVLPVADGLPSVEVHDEVTRGVARGETIADGVNWAKRLIDTPARDLPPRELASRFVTRLGADPHVTVDVWTESRIREERLGGLLGVGAGSAQPTRLVRATYDPAPGESLPHLVLVGKGVTFDSGGLSLKPAESMMQMKTDMTGAAVVAAALSVASRLGVAARITAITPITENLPGERAMRPGDVLTMRDGTTVEVLNTDAEGRLILADALCLAVEAEPDAIIDVATLTGAQRVALGDEIGALFSTADDLADDILRAAGRAGEGMWRLPLAEAYASQLESDVADVRNIGRGPGAGAITAALVLKRFTQGRPWAHLDIAGPGRSDSVRGYVTRGGTAFGTRTLVELLRARAR